MKEEKLEPNQELGSFVPNKNYLITTDNQFYGADGVAYRACYGKVNVVSDTDILNIKTNRGSTNWYVVVGDIEGKHMIIAGCQIHYALQTDKIHIGKTDDHIVHGDSGVVEFNRPTQVYVV